MAEKEKREKSKLMQVLTKEYRWENLVLALLVLVGIVISILILTNVLTIDQSFPVLGQGNVGKVFAWILLSISILGLLLVLYPFIVPALPELKKVSWPHAGKFFRTFAKVMIFTIFLTLILFLFDLVGTEIQSQITTWRES
jgi:preprotein translocase subunit SecE